MANTLQLTVQLQGTPQVLQLLEQLKGKMRETQQITEQAGQTTERSGKQQQKAVEQVGEATLTYRQKLLFLSSSLAGAAALGSAFAKGNEALSKTLQTVSLAISGMGTAIHATANIIRGLMTLLGGWVVAIAAVAVAVVVLVRRWDEALAFARRTWQNFAAFLGRLWDAIAVTAKGFGNILAGVFTFKPERIQEGIETFRQGLRQLGAIAVDVGQQAAGLLQRGWKAVSDFFAGPAKKSTDDLRESVHLLGAEMAAFVATLRATGDGVKALEAAELANQRAMERDPAILQQLVEGYRALRTAIASVLETLAQTRALAIQQERWRQIGETIDATVRQAVDAANRGMMQFLEENRAVLLRIMSPERLDMLLEQARQALTSGWRAIMNQIIDITRGGWDQVIRAQQQKLAEAQQALQADLDFRITVAERIAEANRDAAITSLNVWLESLFEQGRATEDIVRRVNDAISRIATGTVRTTSQISTFWAQAFGQMSVGLQSFANFFDVIWNGIRQGFANVIARIVENFIQGLARMEAAQRAFRFIRSFLSSIPIIGPLLGLFGLQHGGIVMQPSVVRAGEAGPEVIAPLSALQGMVGGGGGGQVVIQFNGPVYMDDFDTWKLQGRIREEVSKANRRESMQPNRLYQGRPAAAWTGGADRSHTSFKSLRR